MGQNAKMFDLKATCDTSVRIARFDVREKEIFVWSHIREWRTRADKYRKMQSILTNVRICKSRKQTSLPSRFLFISLLFNRSLSFRAKFHHNDGDSYKNLHCYFTSIIFNCLPVWSMSIWVSWKRCYRFEFHWSNRWKSGIFRRTNTSSIEF